MAGDKDVFDVTPAGLIGVCVALVAEPKKLAVKLALCFVRRCPFIRVE